MRRTLIEISLTLFPPVDMWTDIMPKTLRPHLLATLTLATTVSVSGCIFPFTRGSQANIDDTVVQLANPGTPEKGEPALAGLPELAAANEADKPVEVAQAPAKKQLPPFARFLGNMIGGGSKQAVETAPEPEAQPQTATLAPVETVEITPAKSLIESDPLLPAPPASPKPESELPPVERQTAASSAPATAHVTSEPTLPPVVKQDATPTANLPEVVSRFSDQETQIIAGSQPSQQDQPSQPPASPEVVVEAVPQEANLDAEAQSPLNQSALLKKAKNNTSSETTTLIRALDLALDTVGEQETPPAVTTTEQAPQVAQSEPETSEPSSSNKEAPQPRFGSTLANGTNPSLPPANGSSSPQSNPLRSGKTDWSGRGSLGTNQAQTIVNNKLTQQPETTSRSTKWSASLEPEMPEETVRKGAQVVAAPQPPPATTVNPYTVNAAQDASAESLPPLPKSPQIITNQMATSARKSSQPISRKAAAKPAISTTNPLHFESSVVNKMQAASELTNWDFEPEESANQSLPEIVEEKPKATAPSPAAAPMPAPQPMPQTTINRTIVPEPQRPTPEPAVIEQQPAAIEPQPAPIEPQEVAQPAIPQAPAKLQPISEPVLEEAPSEIPPTTSAENPAAPIRPRFVPQPIHQPAPATPNPALQTPDLEAPLEPQPAIQPEMEAASVTDQPAAPPKIQAVPARPQTFRPQAVAPPTAPIQPVVESPASASRGVMVRPAKPARLTPESSGDTWRPTPVPANRAPAKLSPVTRPSNNQPTPALPSSAKAYIID